MKGALVFLVGIASTAVGGPPVTLDSLLTEMVNRDSVARVPDPSYICLQSSSYDRASKSKDDSAGWFANGDANQYIRAETNGSRKEWVMMDADGPGAVVRIWSANPKGTMRIYIDGETKPAIEGTMSDILGGKWKAPSSMSYEASKGWNLYLPIPYAKHCKITSDADGFYYHVNYRTYAADTEVTSFSGEAFAKSAGALKAAADQFIEDRTIGFPAFAAGERGVMTGGQAGRDGKVVLDLPPGPCAVNGFMLQLSPPPEVNVVETINQALRSCIVEAELDGEQTIWCPLGEFFGTGASLNKFQDWYRAVGSDVSLRCRWVMPYQKSGKITIHNLGSALLRVDMKARVKSWQWDDRSMHFHCVWRQEYPIHAFGGRGTSDFNYVDIAGKGVYVGDVLSVMNPVKEWWGEGDEKIYVDGEAFPSHFGTGTEDYYGYAWCWPEVFYKPFHAQTRCDGQSLKNNWGRTTVTRTRSLDAIPFSKSLSMNIEVWHWKECDIEYATAAYFYALPGATTNRKPMPEAASKKLMDTPPLPPPYKIAGAIECESLKPSAKSEGTVAVAQGDFGPDLWSGEQQLWVQGKRVGDFVELKLPAKAKSRVIVHATKSWDYGIVRFTVNGIGPGKEVDLCSGKRAVQRSGPIDLGECEPKEGELRLRCEVVGANPKSEGTKSYFGIDCVVLQPVK